MKKRVNSKEKSRQGDREREMMKKKGKTEPKGFSITEHGVTGPSEWSTVGLLFINVKILNITK